MPTIDLAKGTKVPSLKIAKTILSSWNMTITKKGNEYRVTYRKDTCGPVEYSFYEDNAYYTDDLTDACHTGITMRSGFVLGRLSVLATPKDH